ncbi:MAG: AmmeMemoRadiSam system protein A [Dehalobacterium sp.]|jgi:AmmeMemoRadiSam system protein A
MSLIKGIISPHPPIIVPEVGGEERKKAQQTIDAMEKMALAVKEAEPELIIFTTPHGTVFSDAFAVSLQNPLQGDFQAFRAGQVHFNEVNDLAMGEEIIRLAKDQGIPAVGLDSHQAQRFGASLKLDHGITVPLYFIKKAGIKCPILPISIGFMPFREHYQFGKIIRQAIENLTRRTVFVASGDLSHRLTRNAPAGYHPQGEKYDHLLIDLLRKKDVGRILDLEPDFVEDAGECGLRSFIMLLGALDGWDFTFRDFSYEGPYGVGYLVGEIIPALPREEGEILESPPVALARLTLETYIKEGKKIDIPPDLPDFMLQRAAVFVTLKIGGQLRGCIGTIQPTQENMAEEIIQNAIHAGTRDPRFTPVTKEELDDLTYSVDMLSAPEPISGLEELDPQKYGVIVRQGQRAGLLLPHLEGIDTAEDQVDIARQKAGIKKGSPMQLERFEVVRYF